MAQSPIQPKKQDSRKSSGGGGGGAGGGGWTKFGKRGIGNIGGIVCTPHLFWWGVLDVLPNFQKRGLDRTSTLRGGCWGKRG